MDPFYWRTSAGHTTISRLRDPRRANNLNWREVKLKSGPGVPDEQHQGPEVKQDTGRGIRDLLERFGSRTSLMGVQQITSRKGILWKLFWTVVSLMAASMTVYQSWNILQDFIGGKTVQSTTYSTFFEFPSITICSNIHVHNTKKDLINETDLLRFKRENITMMVAMLELIAAAENETGQSLFGVNKFVRKCLYNRIKCDINDDNEFLYFDTLIYGNCFTYNPGIQKPKLSRPNYSVQLVINMEQNSRKKEYNDNYIMLWVHPPGTPPVLYRTDAARIYPGDSVDIKFQMKKIVRLPKSGSECLSNTQDPRRYTSIYYTNATQYLYTAKACVYSLIYEAKKAAFNCVDPAIPRNDKWWHDWHTGVYSICLPGTNKQNSDSDKGNGDSEDDTSNETLFDFEQNCSFPCDEWMVETSVTSTSSWFEALVDISLKGNNKSEKGLASINFDNSKAEIRIGLGAPMTEQVKEDYKYTPGDFAGIIGGNIGVWIGLCAISLAEVIELLISMAARKLFGGGGADDRDGDHSTTNLTQPPREKQVFSVRHWKKSSRSK